VTTKRTRLTWRILEEDEWDEHQRALAAATPHPRPGPNRRRLWAALTLLLLVTLAAGHRFHQAGHRGLDRTQAGIQAAVEREEWTGPARAPRRPDNAGTDRTPVPGRPQPPAGPHRSLPPGAPRVRDMELHGDLALAVVVAAEPDKPWLPLPYRETRTFREGVAGWTRIAPRPDLWGPQQAAETEHFRFLYRRRDASAVAEVMAHVDQAYRDLRRDLGLKSPAAEEVLTVELLPEPVYAHTVAASGHMVFPSPALLPAPPDMAEAEVLQQTLYGALASRLLAEALDRAGARPQWRLLVDGLLLWAGGHSLDPRDRYADYVAERGLQGQVDAGSPPRLADLILDRGRDHPAAEPGGYGGSDYAAPALDWTVRQAAARRWVDYALAIYGQERLAALVTGLGVYGTWEELIPAVFGVPLAEFEAGWQAYLDER
jgi:hypothetical protein